MAFLEDRLLTRENKILLGNGTSRFWMNKQDNSKSFNKNKSNNSTTTIAVTGMIQPTARTVTTTLKVYLLNSSTNTDLESMGATANL